MNAVAGAKRSKRWLIWTVSLLVAAVAATALLAGLERRGIVTTGLLDAVLQDGTGPDSLFPVSIGDETFVVSGRYLRRVQRDDQGSVEQIELALPWPADIDAVLTEETTAPGAARVSDTVFISIQERAVLAETAERLERIYPHYLTDDAPRTLYGLEVRTFADDTAYRSQELLSATLDGGREFALRCDTQRADNMPSTCRRQVVLEAGLVVIYRYHRDHLSDWRAIEEMVAQFIEGMRETATQ